MHGGVGSINSSADGNASGYVAMPQNLRSQGTLRIGFRRRGDTTMLHDSYQSGCIRVRLPRRLEGDRPCAVIINTAGGLADGDSILQDLRWAEGASATVTTQAAEKVYRGLSAGCCIQTSINVEQGADAEWLPQETILFDRARLERDARVMLAADVSFLGLEAVVFGRTAMGERMMQGRLRDRMRIYRSGKLIYADALEVGGEVAALMRRAAICGGAGAMAVIIHASSRAASLLEPARAALAAPQGLAAASSWNGLLAVRLLAPNGTALRADIIAALSVMRGGRPLPRVWRC